MGLESSLLSPLDRVLVVLSYETPELDYFSPRALPFLKDLIDRYYRAGVRLNGLYADEMHIQQDWIYHGHHDEGQFTLRYQTPSVARAFAAQFGAEFADFEKYLVYFTYGQHGFLFGIWTVSGTLLPSNPSLISPGRRWRKTAACGAARSPRYGWPAWDPCAFRWPMARPEAVSFSPAPRLAL